MEKCLCRQVFPQTHKNNCVLFKASSPQKLFQHGGEEMPHFRSEFREPCFMPGVFPKSLFTFFRVTQSTMLVLKTLNSTGASSITLRDIRGLAESRIAEGWTTGSDFHGLASSSVLKRSLPADTDAMPQHTE